MVGSNIGWTKVPYVEVPADLKSVARGAVKVADEVWIVPGVATRADMRPDVMRGDETQLLRRGCRRIGACGRVTLPARHALQMGDTH